MTTVVHTSTQTATQGAEQISLDQASTLTRAIPPAALHDVYGWVQAIKLREEVREVGLIAAAFSTLLIRWKEETAHSSSMSEIVMHPAYQRIIGLGPKVLPFLFRELKENGGHWNWALKALTGENPVPPNQQGKTKKIAEAWLNWASNKNYI